MLHMQVRRQPCLGTGAAQMALSFVGGTHKKENLTGPVI
jgi:hypothetical protein